MKIGRSTSSNDNVLQDIADTYGKGEDDPVAIQVTKTSFYPRQDQLDKLDDLASEYNKKYRRQRKKIDRQDIIRYLIDHCTLESLTDLQK